MTTHASSSDPSKRRRRLAEHYLTRTQADVTRLERTLSLAARALDFPIGQINIIDDRLLYTIGDYGSGATVIPRAVSMCQFLVDDDSGVLAVGDLQSDDRYSVVPEVRDGSVRSYLGAPLLSREATVVGTLCLVDSRAREITAADIERITDFGQIVEDQLDRIRRNAETSSSREVSASLAHALSAGEIVPWYQPVVALSDGRRMGFEALARWQRPDGSVVSPEAFVGAAEDSDLVVDLDRAVVQAAMDDLARWLVHDPRMRIGINLSTRHLELSDGVSFVLDAAQTAGVDPELISVEITETRVLSDLSGASAAVRGLQAAGFKVVLDDFGNGWSGLDWLLSLGADGIKIDRSVTAALGTAVGDAACRALVAMAAELRIGTLIEGIDNEIQLAAARDLGFRLAQGYLWSPPVPAVVVDATV